MYKIELVEEDVNGSLRKSALLEFMVGMTNKVSPVYFWGTFHQVSGGAALLV